MRLKYLLISISIASFCMGCNDQPTCIPERTDLMKLVFVDEFGKEKKITFTRFLVEDILVLQDTFFTSVAISLNPNDSVIDLTFNQLEDTNKLIISYIATPVVLNPECILETKFDFLQIDSTNFINATVVDPLLSLETPKNVEITH